jgi:hypothetical protein
MREKITKKFLGNRSVFTVVMKVVKLFTIILFFLCGFSKSSIAQDLLKLKSGTEIKVNVIEENSATIKYRDFDNPTGPVYTINRDKVESVKYKNGSGNTRNAKAAELEKVKTGNNETSMQTNGFQQLKVKKRYVYLNDVKQSTRNVKTIMEDYPEAIRNYESGKKMCDISNACAIGVMITSFVASSIANKKEYNTDRIRIASIGLAIDGGFIITAIILSSYGKRNIKKSVSLYNSAAGKPVSYNVNAGLQENGIGFGIQF